MSLTTQIDLIEPPVRDLFIFEKRFYREGFSCIAGIDEAGRGPLAGPVVAAAVILPVDFHLDLLPGLDDSKLLSAGQREQLAPLIRELALGWAIRSVGADRIDETNILAASHEAMFAAAASLAPQPDFLLVDGNQPIPNCSIRQKTIVKGDGLSASIAAASILAKTERDRLMVQLDCSYPDYGFAGHKGYGTKAHLEAIKRFGPCPIHRKSFRPLRTASKGT